MDDAAYWHFEAVRQQYFPPEKNRMEAHITLFHCLPGEEKAAILRDMEQAAAGYAPFDIPVSDVMRLKRGAAYQLESERLQALYATLFAKWAGWLNPETRDRPFIPHITVQNKVEPEEAAKTYETLRQDFTPRTLTATGLDMWELINGKWQLDQSRGF